MLNTPYVFEWYFSSFFNLTQYSLALFSLTAPVIIGPFSSAIQASVSSRHSPSHYFLPIQAALPLIVMISMCSRYISDIKWVPGSYSHWPDCHFHFDVRSKVMLLHLSSELALPCSDLWYCDWNSENTFILEQLNSSWFLQIGILGEDWSLREEWQSLFLFSCVFALKDNHKGLAGLHLNAKEKGSWI